jgi:hypothetical protein
MTQRARRTGTPNQGRDLLDFPLAGRLFWHDGRAFGCIESSSRKGKRYRYCGQVHLVSALAHLSITHTTYFSFNSDKILCK